MASCRAPLLALSVAMDAANAPTTVAKKTRGAERKPAAAAGKKAAAAAATAAAAAAEAEAATAAAAAAAAAKAGTAASAVASSQAEVLFRSSSMCRSYRWSSNDPDTVAKTKLRLAEMKHTGRKSSMNFDSVQVFDDGFAIDSKEPAKYKTAFAWFSRAFGAFQEFEGNNDQWRVAAVGSGAKVAKQVPDTATSFVSRSVVPAVACRAAPSVGGPFHPSPGFKLLRGCMDRRAAGWPRELPSGPTIAARARGSG